MADDFDFACVNCYHLTAPRGRRPISRRDEQDDDKIPSLDT